MSEPTTIDTIVAEFRRAFRDCNPSGVWAAPARVNLIGEHTDYNEGFVLPLAIEQRVCVAAAPAAGPRSRIRSVQRADAPVDFSAATVEPGSVPGWAAHVAGVVWALRTSQNRAIDVDLLVDGNVPLGAGLSSSAALQCATAIALADLSGLVLGRTQIATQARRAENEFVGVPTGIMDQMVSMHATAGHLVFCDIRSLAVEPIAFALQDHGLALLVIDTGAPHDLVHSAYADRRASCDAAARILGVRALRDVPFDGLEAALARLPDDQLCRRVRHVVTENQRVLDVVAALRSGLDPRTIGPTLTASHASLKDDFEVTAPALDVAVEVALDAGAFGARMTGGGFGGCVIALVDVDQVDRVRAGVEFALLPLRPAEFAPPASFVARASAGARRLGSRP